MRKHPIAVSALLVLCSVPALASDIVLQFRDTAWPDRPSSYELMGWCNPVNGYVPVQDCGYGGIGASSGVGTDTAITLRYDVFAWRESTGYDRYVLFGSPGVTEAVFRVVFDVPAPGADLYQPAALTMSLITGDGVAGYVAALPSSAAMVGQVKKEVNKTYLFSDTSCFSGGICPGDLFMTWGSALGGSTPPLSNSPPDGRDGPMFDITALPVGLSVVFIPEPTSSSLALAGLLGMGWLAGRRRPDHS